MVLLSYFAVEFLFQAPLRLGGGRFLCPVEFDGGESVVGLVDVP